MRNTSKLKGILTGIDLVNTLEYKLPVVYLTANSDQETISKVLKTQPASFLTKPFNEKELIVAIELAASKYVAKNKAETKPLPFVFLKSGKSFEKVDVADILYIQANGSYCRVITNQKEYVIIVNLNTVGEGFSQDDFMRIHRSYMINMNKIESIDQEYLRIGGKDISVGRTYKDELKTKFRRFT